MPRSERLLRAVAAACLSTGVALAMHVAGGGPMPSLAGIAAPFLLAVAVSAQLAGVALSRWRLALAVTASQAAFHLLFSWGIGASVSVAATPGAGAHAGHHQAGLALDTATTAPAAHAHLTPSMLAAHALAALGTYAVLRHSELLLEAGRRWAVALLMRLNPPSPPRLAPLGRVFHPRGAPRVRPRIVASPQGLRGPPFSFA